MSRSDPSGGRAVILGLCLFAISVMAWRVLVLGYSLDDLLPRTRYDVSVAMSVDGHDGNVRVRTFLPTSDRHQQIGDERNSSPLLHFSTALSGPNREGEWTGSRVPDGAVAEYGFSVMSNHMRFDVAPDLPVPEAYPASVAPFLRPEPDIQVDDPEVRATLASIGADQGPMLGRLRAIHDFTAALDARPFKGTTDALTALRLGEASCNGKSRLFVALARASGIPARLVGGLILTSGTKRTSHQWVEAYVAGHWVSFCPTNDHFAELPESYLALYRGDEALFQHTADINYDYAFTTSRTLVPSPKALASLQPFNILSLFERMDLPFSLLRTLLMLPVGALVVVVFRNVVGMPTFGTFLPALIAGAAGATGPLWGVTGLLIVTGAVVGARWAMQRLGLLHSPTLAILLAVVTTSLLATSLLAERAGLLALAHVTLFPIAVLAITAERFYLTLTEHGPKTAAKEMGGTVVVILACYLVMNSLALQMLVLGFPEVLLLVVAADIYLGRWVGIRVFEYLRFRHVLLEEVGP